jgi:hypothetical protein
MNSDIRERLRRLGVRKGAAHLKPSAAKRLEIGDSRLENSDDGNLQSPISNLQALTPIPTPYGEAVLRRARFSLDWAHGERRLNEALAHPTELIARLVGRSVGRSVEPFDLREALFIDTETTGLAGGAGTLAFLVGVGYFEQDRFTVDQYFLRDPGEEAAMLSAIEEMANARANIVTFNGKAFDVPLVETRFVMNRLVPPFGEKAHLDLLMPARRAWRGMIGDCSLGSLEYHLLGVRRDEQDIAGFLIPELYRQYLQSGSHELTSEMSRVMYHNLHDILSMVTLTARLADAQLNPGHISEHIALGKQHEREGEWAEAENVYRRALEGLEIGDWRLENNSPKSPISNLQSPVLNRLASAIKKQHKHSEAVTYWVALADAGDVTAMIELAKHYEWREVDLPLALTHAKTALRQTEDRWLREVLEKRVMRLERKMNQ